MSSETEAVLGDHAASERDVRHLRSAPRYASDMPGLRDSTLSVSPPWTILAPVREPA